ncbi:hypothetical protein LTR94_031332, partial [Friedmanniomyces endolithicus]
AGGYGRSQCPDFPQLCREVPGRIVAVPDLFRARHADVGTHADARAATRRGGGGAGIGPCPARCARRRRARGGDRRIRGGRPPRAWRQRRRRGARLRDGRRRLHARAGRRHLPARSRGPCRGASLPCAGDDQRGRARHGRAGGEGAGAQPALCGRDRRTLRPRPGGRAAGGAQARPPDRPVARQRGGAGP